ncbi:AsmA protein [Sphingomonas sp. MM-1]|uniref:AsmA family protein n=1 Tax=Sphingomonas sp. MM-1 TaxID=745310 RepID=UPI0002C11A74|nr:AsmA family protein [Sphingomonas sp. MM-1]AGH49847.1 AsmA protein [Sphingomonas sp. MM-1]
MADRDPSDFPGRATVKPTAAAPAALPGKWRIGRGRPWPRPVRIAIRIIAALVGLLILAWAILFITKGRFLKPTFERIATASAGRDVRVAGDFQFYFNLINLKFVAEGLRIANPGWATRPTLFEARRIDLDGATIAFLFGKRRINRLDLADGRLDLEWDAAGRRNSWTFGDPDRPGKPLDLPVIRRATVAGTRLRYSDPRMQLAADMRFETIRAADTRFAGDVRFSGEGRMRGHAFTLSGGLLSPNETVAGGRNRLVAAARSGRTALDVSGTLPAATRIEGADLRLVARGPDLALLFDFLGVAIPETRAYRFTSHLTKDGEAWKFTSLAGRFGNSDLAGRMTITMPGGRLRIDAGLRSDAVDIIDVGPFIGYDPERLAAQGAKGAVRRVNGAPRLLPDAPLRIEAIRNFDAHVDYAVRAIRAPNLPISNVALTLDLDRSLLKLSPLTMDVAGGKLASDITLNARARPVMTSYDIRLAPTPMGRLLKGWGVEESGTSGVVKARVRMKGAGDTVHESLAHADGRIAVILPAGTFWTRNIQLSELDVGTFITKMFEDKLKKPVAVNCGLIAFTVRQGVAAADPILIDTDKNVMLGTGSFSFRDESLDLKFRADGKKFSLLSAQSPVRIGGYFAAPALGVIGPELLARGGAGVALGLVASPIAPILAFVDIGDAKSAACGPVLAGAKASGQRTSKGKPRDDVGSGRPKG